MTRLETEEFLEYTLRIGRNMVESGAEIGRVEDTVTRICRAYDFAVLNAYAVTTLIQLTIRDEAGNHYTQSARILSSSVDLGRVEELNALSRHVCQTRPALPELRTLLTEPAEPPRVELIRLLGNALAAGSFSVFFGGSLADGAASAVVGAVAYLLERFLALRRLNRFVFTALAAFLCGCLAMLFVRVGFGTHADKVIIGDVMLFIPTLSIVSGVRELFCRDLTTGLLRLLEAAVVTGALALGYAGSLILLGGGI